MRENTERPITVDVGTNKLVGTDPAEIVEQALASIDAEERNVARPEHWDGHASVRILDALWELLAEEGRVG